MVAYLSGRVGNHAGDREGRGDEGGGRENG
jgi:hypothetical protein